MKTIIAIAALAALTLSAVAEDKKACCPSPTKKVAVVQTAAKKQAAHKCDGKCEETKTTKLANGKDACCKSTPAKPIAVGEKGCCNAAGELAKFKLMVNGNYKYYGCEGSAGKARKDLASKGAKVGKVQPVSGKVKIS